MTSTSYLWESTAVDPFLSFDDSNLIHLLQDTTYPSQPAPKSKDSTPPSQDSANPNRISNPNPISPPYSDSSPSPSSANEDGNGDVDHKRKASVDDIDIDDEQRASKSPTTDGRSKRSIAPSRRKSGGERYQDETKLLKRKEQNRAAQRAFRERKEKHVKDLEDKVAQLEAKSDTQATENDNLRDMLNRLQSENSLLRQAAFTFTLPTSNSSPPSNPFSAPEPGPSRLHTTNSNSNNNNINNNRISEPQSNFNNSQYSSEPLSSLTDNTLSDADLDSMALFGGPFTTVASNPMFMSYRDPTQSMNAFASFGGWDDMSMLNTNSSTFGDFSALSNLNNSGEDITSTLKTSSGISPYDVEFQAALKKATTPQEAELCMIDQLCSDMQRKATCSALH